MISWLVIKITMNGRAKLKNIILIMCKNVIWTGRYFPDSDNFSDIGIYLYIFAYAEAFYALFSPFKYIIIIFEAILTQLSMHI